MLRSCILSRHSSPVHCYVIGHERIFNLWHWDTSLHPEGPAGRALETGECSLLLLSPKCFLPAPRMHPQSHFLFLFCFFIARKAISVSTSWFVPSVFQLEMFPFSGNLRRAISVQILTFLCFLYALNGKFLLVKFIIYCKILCKT